MSDEITIGEIGRAMERLEDSQRFQTDKIEKILLQTTATNGRVTALERDVRDIKRTRASVTSEHEQRRASDSPNVITVNIPINAKTIMAILAAAGTIAVMGWKAGLLG